jgi:hypothetical protein
VPLKPGRPPGPPINGQPRPPAQSGDGPLDPGVFYLYDNTAPESSYLSGEPCRIVCQSDPSVQCSSYTGDCQGLSDQVICDGQVFHCPSIEATDSTDAPQQAAVQDQAAKLDQAAQPCGARDDLGQDRQGDRRQGREHGRDRGRHAGNRQGCDQGCRQGQTSAGVPCSGTNPVP